MKSKLYLLGLTTVWLTAVMFAAPAPTPAKPLRVGVYDSRIVAFAHFWSPQTQKKLNEDAAAAKTESKSGPREKSASLADRQKGIHLQVFSTAPATEAMTALQSRLPALQAELGVDRFVSKWDVAALRDIPEANRIDVTDRLVREFDVPAQRAKTIEAMKRTAPLPLDEAQRLAEAGTL
jgi:hypothetical protein